MIRTPVAPTGRYAPRPRGGGRPDRLRERGGRVRQGVAEEDEARHDLVNSHGRTLYGFTRDSRNKDRCVTTSGCTSTWPVAASTGKPTAGPGVKSSKLSTITLSNGSRQVTYAGHPLYTYVGDSSAGETDYVGRQQFGGTWLAVNGAGKLIK